MNKFFFIDLETTGLDERQNCILEVAAIITDNKLNIIEEYTAPIQAAPIDLALMDTWCKTTHAQSRLLQDIEEKGIALADAEKELQKLKRKHFPVNKAELCGSSVHFDKRFIDRHMATFSKELSHRIVDVSSFMLALNKYHNIQIERSMESSHRALLDIRDSIRYLKKYLEMFK